MAVYGPVRSIYCRGPYNIFLGDGPVHILPYDPQCHELFALYAYRCQPTTVTDHSPIHSTMMSGEHRGMISCGLPTTHAI
jgi:hypothetical protein